MTPRIRQAGDDAEWSALAFAAVRRHATIGVTLRSIAGELPTGSRRPWLRLAAATDTGDEPAANAVARSDPWLCLPLISCASDDPRLLARLLQTALADRRTRLQAHDATNGDRKKPCLFRLVLQWINGWKKTLADFLHGQLDLTAPPEAQWAPLAYGLLVAVVALALLGVVAVSMLIMPLVQNLVNDFGVSPPAITRFVLGIGGFIATGWKPGLLIAIATVPAWAAATRLSPRRARARARFTRGLAWLVGGGVPVDAAIRAAARAAGTPCPDPDRPTAPLTHAAVAALAHPPAAAAALLEAVADCHEAHARRRRDLLAAAAGVAMVLAVAIAVALVSVALLAPLVGLVSDLS